MQSARQGERSGALGGGVSAVSGFRLNADGRAVLRFVDSGSRTASAACVEALSDAAMILMYRKPKMSSC
jgi:hypothetical protein